MGIKEKEIELETLKREIAQAEASLEQDFIKHMVDKTNEKVEDLFFSNKPEFYRFVFTEQNNYLREKLTDKVGRAMDLSDEIQRDRENEEIEKDKEAFLKKHPEVDFNELLDFYNEEVPNRLKKQIDKLEGEAFFEAILDYLNAVMAKQEESKSEKEEESKLPKEVLGNGVSGVGYANNENIMTRY
ncbi:Coiled-coil domain-containing protein [Helicobacter pylori]|uniref:Coiled-coil domain-containing protein n=1 Tax=Helicobacter pylori TaxID=210 RepID=UPI0011CC60BD|nr:Coiled-coil domain-containing protein [Helicobacter pylori]QEE97100.1 Coiled-coil domain-containing protein [Helicobacter pylori]QEE98117.1 Coiled-coil domain-containing protein [Helicobacter pylori]